MPCTTDNPEPGPFADLLGGEERIEDALDHGGGDAGARVADRQPHIVPGHERAAGQRRDARPAGRSSRPTLQHAAAMLHGVNGVGAEIHRHLMQVGGIADHRRIPGSMLPLQPYSGRAAMPRAARASPR